MVWLRLSEPSKQRQGLESLGCPGIGELPGDGDLGHGFQAEGGGRGEVGEMEPGGETHLSEVMLTFQAGGERTSVPRLITSPSCA